MDISIIIVTFNAKDVTLKMLDSLKLSLKALNEIGVSYEVIIVDNGSTDGVVQAIENAHSNWVKLEKAENNGFSKGNNTGIALSDQSSKYALFLNPDIILEENSILDIYKYIEEHIDVDVATCKVDLWSGGIDWDCHRGFPTPWRAFCYFTGLEKLFGSVSPKLFGGYHLLHEDLSTIHEIDVCLGAYMMVRKISGERIGWWPEDYFLNGEDVDFCYQIKEINGGKIIYNPSVKIIHYKGASKGTKKESAAITKASDASKKLQINSGIDAMKIFYDKYYKNKYGPIMNMIVNVGVWLLLQKRLLLKKE